VSVAISRDGRYVAGGSFDTVVRIWEVSSGVLVKTLRGHGDGVSSVAFTPDGNRLVSGSLDKTLKYWDVSGLGAIGESQGVKTGKKEKIYKETTLAGSDSMTSTSTNPISSSCVVNVNSHHDQVYSIAISHDGTWIVSGSRDQSVQFLDARTAIVQCLLVGHKDKVINVDLSPAGNFLATGSADGMARIWRYGVLSKDRLGEGEVNLLQ